MKTSIFILLISSWLLLDACRSGKSALKQGDYYEAVMQAVNRLRQNPDNKKSQEVLRSGYQMAIDYLETDVQNQLASNANLKYKNIVQDYESINYLYEQIRTSPGALRVIPNPINKYKELPDLKAKASEELYEAGIQSMLKNTREDAKHAYFFFNEANNYTPGYRESIEMIEQSKFNATLKVIVEPSLRNYYDWNFEPVIFNANRNEFVKFYTPREAQDANLQQVDHFVRVQVNGYSEDRPTVTRRVEEYRDSVKVGEKTVNNQKVPVYEKVSAKMTIFEKSIIAKGSITLYVKDARSNAELRNSDLISEVRWSDRWATCTGDLRALTEANKKLCGTREPFMNRDFLITQTKRDLDNKLSGTLSSYYNNF